MTSQSPKDHNPSEDIFNLHVAVSVYRDCLRVSPSGPPIHSHKPQVMRGSLAIQCHRIKIVLFIGKIPFGTTLLVVPFER